MAKESGIEAIVSKATFARVLSCVSSKETGGAVLGVLRMRFGTVGEVIAVEGKTAMADAMHCQREACRRVIQRKGDYLFGLKENQPALLEDVRPFLITQMKRRWTVSRHWKRMQDALKRGLSTPLNSDRLLSIPLFL